MNIVCARLGKAIRFRRKDIGSFAFSGAGEARTLFIKLANLNPQNTYYLIGRSDYSRLKEEERKEIFLHNNVVDVWSDFKDYEDEVKYEDFVLMKMKDVEVDYGVMFGGVLSLSLPNTIKTKKDPNKYAKPMSCYYNYGAPVVNYLNQTKVPWICCNTDTRYYPVKSDDLLNPEKAIVGMWDSEFTVERLKEFGSDEIVEYKIPSFYTGIETLFLADEGKYVSKNEEKTKGLVIFHNQDGKLNKKKILQEYVFDNGLDVEIYGKWKDVEDDDRFKGFLKIDDLHEVLDKTKYTFIIPMNKTPLCSMKFYECLHYGIIPFLHEYYDMDRKLDLAGLPEICRLNSPEELKEKIDLLESDEELYLNTLKQLKSMLKPEYYTGEHINNEINKTLKYLNLI